MTNAARVDLLYNMLQDLLSALEADDPQRLETTIQDAKELLYEVR